ncbi:MAG: DUF192 domain-containing protein [Halanaeroarchaeum sp.]
MPTRSAWIVLAVLVVALALAVPIGGPEPRTGLSPTATVAVIDEDGETLGTVAVAVADTPGERYTGLSDTAALEPDEGMLFIFPEEARRTFVMRDMAVPIDMIFVGANRTITAIYHAPVEGDRPLTEYTGEAKWVVEVPYGWTTRHDVTVGDRVRIADPR